MRHACGSCRGVAEQRPDLRFREVLVVTSSLQRRRHHAGDRVGHLLIVMGLPMIADRR